MKQRGEATDFTGEKVVPCHGNLRVRCTVFPHKIAGLTKGIVKGQ